MRMSWFFFFFFGDYKEEATAEIVKVPLVWGVGAGPKSCTFLLCFIILFLEVHSWQDYTKPDQVILLCFSAERVEIKNKAVYTLGHGKFSQHFNPDASTGCPLHELPV